MKGLLYKNLLLVWKQMKLVLLLVVLFCLIPQSISNLRSFFLIYAAILVPTTLMSLDEQDRWLDFAAMLPCSTRDMVLSYYLSGWLFLGLGTAAYLAGLFLFSAGHLPSAEDWSTLAYSLACALVCQGVTLPLLFRFGCTRGRAYLVVLVVVFSAVLGASLALSGVSALVSLPGGWGALLLAAVLSGASVSLSERCFWKRSSV